MQTGGEIVLTTRVDPVDVAQAGRLIADWARESRGRTICATNVHMVMEGFDDPSFAAVVNGADLVVADGRPIVWACRLLGQRDQGHVRGFDLTAQLCDIAEREQLKVGFYGGEPETLQATCRRLIQLHPDLQITYAYSPPFRQLTPEEDAAVVTDLRGAGVQLLFVGLGCPKQERWMASHRDRLPCAAVGVGAVFDMLAGRRKTAPLWLQRAGLEWVFRLSQEPRRLSGRYAKHNLRFAVCFTAQVARRWRGTAR